MSNQPFDNSPMPIDPPVIAAGSSSTSKAPIIIAVLAIVGVIALGCMGVMVGLLLPAVQSAREAARRMSSGNNLKQIGLAMHNHASTFSELFPAGITVDANGQPLHSWRTTLLPFIEYSNIHSQIDLTKPWDDSVNLPYSSSQMLCYSCPSSRHNQSELTIYQAVIHPSSILYSLGNGNEPLGSQSVKMDEVTDGLSNTILVVETTDQEAVPWMKPADLPFENLINPAGASVHPGGRLVLMADGSVIFMSDSTTPDEWESLVTRNGGENVEEIIRKRKL